MFHIRGLTLCASHIWLLALSSSPLRLVCTGARVPSSLHCGVVFHYRDTPHSADPFTSWRPSGPFPVFWLWTMLLWTLAHRFLCQHMCSVVLSRYLGVELLGHMVNLCVTSEETANVFSKEMSHQHPHRPCTRRPASPKPCSPAIVEPCERVWTGASHGASSETNDVNHPSRLLTSYLYILWWNRYSNLLSIF